MQDFAPLSCKIFLSIPCFILFIIVCYCVINRLSARRGMATEKQCKSKSFVQYLCNLFDVFSEDKNHCNYQYCKDYQINENGFSSKA
jgi:hypothetical protein